MRRADRELKSKEELKNVLDSGRIIQVAFIDNNEPYIVTLNYGYIWNDENITLYFHSAREGRKVSCIKTNPRVCFTIAVDDSLIQGEKACNHGMKYRSIVGYGRIRIVEDRAKKLCGLNVLMKQYTQKVNWAFDENMLEKTLVYCLEVETISGKSRK